MDSNNPHSHLPSATTDFAGEQDTAAAPMKVALPEPLLVLNRSALKGELIDPIPFFVSVNRKPLRIPLRRLTASEMEQVSVIYDFLEGRARGVQPPRLQDRNGQHIGYDEENPEYREKVVRMRKKARAWAIWLACEAVHDSADGVPTQDQAVALVDGVLPETLQEKMLAAIIGGGITIGERVDFFSDAASAPS